MLTKEIAKKILENYKKGLKGLPNGVEGAKSFLDYNSLHAGICAHASSIFNIDLYQYSEWGNINYDGHIFRVPQHCETLEEIKEFLQFRIDWLKNFIK